MSIRSQYCRGAETDCDHFTRAQTNIMTTILEEPYMMLRKTKPGEILHGNDRYEGYCKDLTDAITKLTGIKFLIQPVKDGKYGSPDGTVNGGWNGELWRWREIRES